MSSQLNKTTFLRFIFRWILRFFLFVYYAFLLLCRLIPKRKLNEKVVVLATGTFYSDHWLITHLKPMAGADNCQELIMVASTVVPDIENVRGVYAPKWLEKISGKVGARLIYFSWLAIKLRPDIIVGFHLLLNGLFAVFLSKLIRGRSVYICGGGPREVLGGGVYTENRIFNRLGTPDLFVESILLRAVNNMDLVITMGSSAITYFRSKNVTARCEIVAGGFDEKAFLPDEKIKKIYDFILIGRLSDVKRVDRFLQAIKIAKANKKDITAVIVGDGPDKNLLEEQSQRLDLNKQVTFVGWQNNVDFWLKQSKCFVLTSDSEGLSQALIQAMMVGLPSITSKVGDLGDLLKHEENGYLINDLTPESFAESFVLILENQEQYKAFSKQALMSTSKFANAFVADYWRSIFSSFNDH